MSSEKFREFQRQQIRGECGTDCYTYHDDLKKKKKEKPTAGKKDTVKENPVRNTAAGPAKPKNKKGLFGLF